MTQVLYRQYRPKNFAEVVGQEHVTSTLINQVTNKRLGHAYLFTGPRGVGKTSVARILARAVNCLNPQSYEPDNSCALCMETFAGKNLDLIEIDAASHTGVDNIREIIEHLPIPPSKGNYRVFIIDEVHMLSRGAFNAILKTLEEPPAHALFILATTEVHKVPETVISRTQRFDFRKLTSSQILEHLSDITQKQSVSIGEEVLRSISESADGSLRDALVLLEKASHFSNTPDVREEEIQRLIGLTPMALRERFLELIRKNDSKAAIAFINDIFERGYSLEQFNKDFLEFLRTKLGNSFEDDVRLSLIIDHFLEAHGQMRITPIPSLPLMVAAIKSINAKSGGNIQSMELDKSANHAPQKTTKHNLDTRQQHTITSDKIEEKWMDVLARVREYNQSLLTALKLARPTGTVNGSVTIAFPYKFHAETVNAAKNRLVIERALEEVFGHKLNIKCVAQSQINHVSEDEDVNVKPKKQVGNSELVQSALEILGGELVE